MTNAPQRTHAPGIRVPGWQDALGAWVERRPRLWRRLGNWETAALQDRLGEVAIDRPTYICGLARSGTTILLTLLTEHPETTTHRYRDFPALFTPWAWNWFVDRAARRNEQPSERAHGDGLMVTADSPEAFEEVLWTAFWPPGQETVGPVLDRSSDRPDFESFYRDHIRKLFLVRGGSRYVAKGNYNLIRLRYLHKIFPDAKFVIMVRDPVWHIASLMRQHQRFRAMHEIDRRGRRYMRRAGHFEFGLDRRPIDTGDPRVASVAQLWRGRRELAGWALYWAVIHDHLSEALATDAGLRNASLVVRYEDFCANPEQVLAAILTHCELTDAALPELARARVAHPEYYRPPFSEEEIAYIRRITGCAAARVGYSLPPDDAGASTAVGEA